VKSTTSKTRVISESELMVLTPIYALAVQKCQEKQRATRSDGHDDRKMLLNTGEEADMT
jgi:hypothetical protein